MNKGQPRKLDDWGALRAWAWGASRALDYFETDKAVECETVGVEGHSRFGKAAAVAMAYDPRFAIAYISSSGEGGVKAAPSQLGRDRRKRRGAQRIPLDGGKLSEICGAAESGRSARGLARTGRLCAPRPVFIGAGATNGDGWVDAKGMFLAAVGAGPVYRLLGKKDLGTSEFPPIETALIDGDVAFRQHSGGHTPAPNWPTFITFAGKYM